MLDCFPLGFCAETLFVVSWIADSYCGCLFGPYASGGCFDWLLLNVFLVDSDNQYFGM